MRSGRLTRAFSFLVLILVTLPHSQTSAQGANVPADVSSLLTKVAGFGSTDVASLQAGRVITRTEESPELLEGSVVTAVKIATTKERALDYFRLLVSYVDGQVTLAYGTFSRPP